MMETAKSFFERISTQLALYLVCTCIVVNYLSQFMGFAFLVGVIFGICSTVIIQVYVLLKLFSYEDYMRKSSEIEENRAYWNDKIKNYHRIRDLKFTYKMVQEEMGVQQLAKNESVTSANHKNELLKVNSEGRIFIDDDSIPREMFIEGVEYENELTVSDNQKMTKSLLDLNDNYSNIMLSSGYNPMELMRKDSIKILSKNTHQHEDDNFEVSFHSRLKNIEFFVKYFITYLGKVIDVEDRMNFNKITSQRSRYKIIKKEVFEIFKKGNKWVQLRFIFAQIEKFHQQNAVFISNGVKGQFEAFLTKNNEKYEEFKAEYESIKNQKYKALNQMDKLQKQHEQSKENLAEVLLQYEKAKKEMIKYDKMLEMEMKAKLAQKAVQDETANVLATKDLIKELRDEMKKATDKYIHNLTLAYKDKLEVFLGALFSLINSFSDLCTEWLTLIDDVLVQDQAESNAEETYRNSIVKRSITNMKRMLEKASPNRQNISFTQLLNENKKITKNSIKQDMNAFKTILKVSLKV